MQPNFIFYGITGGPTALYQLPSPNVNLFWLVGSGKGNVFILSTKLKQNFGVIYDGSINTSQKNDTVISINSINAILTKYTDNESIYDVWIHQRSYGMINIELILSGSTATSFSIKNIQKKYIDVKCFGFVNALFFENNMFVIDHLGGICIFNSNEDYNCDKNMLNLDRDKYGIPMVMKKIGKEHFVLATDGGFLIFVNVMNKKIIHELKPEKISAIFGLDVFGDKIIVGTRSQKYWIGNLNDILNDTSYEITYSVTPSGIPSKLTNISIEPNEGKFFAAVCKNGGFIFCKESKTDPKKIKMLREINYDHGTISSISWENCDNAYNLLVGLREDEKLCYWKF